MSETLVSRPRLRSGWSQSWSQAVLLYSDSILTFFILILFPFLLLSYSLLFSNPFQFLYHSLLIMSLFILIPIHNWLYLHNSYYVSFHSDSNSQLATPYGVTPSDRFSFWFHSYSLSFWSYSSLSWHCVLIPFCFCSHSVIVAAWRSLQSIKTPRGLWFLHQKPKKKNFSYWFFQ